MISQPGLCGGADGGQGSARPTDSFDGAVGRPDLWPPVQASTMRNGFRRLCDIRHHPLRIYDVTTRSLRGSRRRAGVCPPYRFFRWNRRAARPLAAGAGTHDAETASGGCGTSGTHPLRTCEFATRSLRWSRRRARVCPPYRFFRWRRRAAGPLAAGAGFGQIRSENPFRQCDHFFSAILMKPVHMKQRQRMFAKWSEKKVDFIALM